MQRADFTLRIYGQLTFTVEKVNMTAAEAVVLRDIHGSDAILNIRPRGNDKTAHHIERQRLVEVYGNERIESLFPGFAAKLPASYRDAQFDLPGSKAAPAAPPATESEAESPEDAAADDRGDAPTDDGFVGLEDAGAGQPAAAA